MKKPNDSSIAYCKHRIKTGISVSMIPNDRFDNENGELWSKATLYRALLGWDDYKKDPALLTAIEKAVKNVMEQLSKNQSHPFYSVNPDAGGLTHGLAFTDVLEQLYVLTKKQAYLDYCLFLYKDFSTQTLNEDAQFKKLQQADLPLKGHGVHTYEHLRCNCSLVCIR